MSDTLEFEIYIFWLAIGLIILGILGSAAHYFIAKESIVFNIIHYLGILGVILLPGVFGISAAMGRLDGFLNVLRNEPSRFFSSIFTGESIATACQNGICATYCCEDPTGKIKWRDCERNCSSRIGAVGILTGDDCKYDTSREAVCKRTGVGTTIKQQEGMCNYLETQGPITCTCCYDSYEQKRWWDCNPDCTGGLPELKGTKQSVADCIVNKVARLECQSIQDQSDTVDVKQKNEQSF